MRLFFANPQMQKKRGHLETHIVSGDKFEFLNEPFFFAFEGWQVCEN